MYAKYFKRILDFCLSLIGLIVLSPIFLILIVFGTIFMRGNPFFCQKRPGKDEKIFKLIKFRTMDNRKDKDGNLLPDEIRLNKYGRFLRSTSLEGNDKIRQITKSLINKGFREVSPILFFNGCNQFSDDFREMIAQGNLQTFGLNTALRSLLHVKNMNLKIMTNYRSLNI